MAESVETGGLMKFSYGKANRQEVGEHVKREIREAYERAEERKKKERNNKIIWWILGILLFIILLVSVYLSFFNNN